MKIDKNGWSLATEIMFMVVFMLCLLISIYYINKMGLLGINAINNLNGSDYKNNTVVKQGKDTTYEDIEDTLLYETKKYIKRNYSSLGIDTLIITSSKLIEANILDKNDLSDPDKQGAFCTGYVEVENVDDKTFYTPYISCSKYTTKGYIKRRDYNE